MKRWVLALLCAGALAGCKRYEPIATEPPVLEAEIKEEMTEDITEEIKEDITEETAALAVEETEAEIRLEIEESQVIKKAEPVKVKGIYLSAYVAGTESMVDNIIENIDRTELNAVVIDVKDDNGRITFDMDSPVVNEIGACEAHISDMEGLAKKLKDKGIYMIARVVAFRDPYLAEMKPEWSLKTADGQIYRDKKGLAWVNPYKKEVWDYLVEVGKEAKEAGFDEVQFDYIRFSTEKSMENVVFDENDTLGRDKITIINEFIDYAGTELEKAGLYVSADVFGTIIGSEIDAERVGQRYGDMAKHLDYICPMIYPSHYGDGNFGIEHPDTQPYDTILGALTKSKEDLAGYATEGERQAVVRPWLQDFTASYLEHYITYGDEEIRAQIQAVYDAGYEEWILWSAANKYHYGGLLQE